MRRIDDKDISIALIDCDGNLAEVAQSLDTDSDTLSSYIRASLCQKVDIFFWDAKLVCILLY